MRRAPERIGQGNNIMATLPPSPFFSSTACAEHAAEEALVVASRSQAPVAAASGPFSSVAIVERPAEAPAVASTCPKPEDAAAECFISEIFVGAAKLEPFEMWFENTAYPREDELLYDVLKAMDNPHTADLIEMPYGMEGLFDPMPLFMQRIRA